MKLEFFLEFFKKYSNIKFHENPSSGSRIVNADGRTYMTMLIVTSRNFAKAPKHTPNYKLQTYKDMMMIAATLNLVW
jgi:hypothetical protein